MTDLEKSIFRTVAFFSLLQLPLTSFEIWKWLIAPSVPYRLEDVESVLGESAWLSQKLGLKNGFYFLQGADESVKIRHKRFLNAQKKFKRLKFVMQYLRFVPTVRAVAVGNNLAWANTREESDIDLFVITKRGRLWSTRLFTVLPFALLGMRPKPGAIDPVDFSFFLSEEAKDIKWLCISKHDIYLAQWVRSLVPVFGSEVIEQFVRSNGWVERTFPNSFHVHASERRKTKPLVRFPEVFGLIENIAKKIQKRKLPVSLSAIANTNTCVVVNENMLKFHANDRRQLFHNKLQELCHKAGIE